MTNRKAKPIDVTVGKNIRKIRKMQGLSIKDLADKIGASFQQFQKYETAANRISAGTLHAIAGALKVSIMDLFAPTERLSSFYSETRLVFFETEQGLLEDVPASFDYIVERFDADPTVGQMDDDMQVTCKINWVKVGELTLDRNAFIQMAGEDEADIVEERIGEEIRTELMAR